MGYYYDFDDFDDDDECKLIKNFEMTVEGTWKDTRKSKCALVIDEKRMTIDICHLSGSAPSAFSVILFLLQDKDVRKMIRLYQQRKKRKLPYKIRATKGMSGAENFYINFYNDYGIYIEGKKLLHISCFGKLNEGFPEMYIGDFVELISFFEIHRESLQDKYRKKILKMSGCRYIKTYTCFDASTNISRII